MDYLQYRTRNGSKPDGKPKVCFTSHPEDVNRWLESTISDFHATSDCAVCFAEDMASDFGGEDWEHDLSRLGDQEGAVKRGEQAWRLRCDSLGESHPATLTSLSNLALYHSRLGGLQGAVALGEQAWRLRRDILGEAHPRTLSTLRDLVDYLTDSGDGEKAAELKRELERLGE